MVWRCLPDARFNQFVELRLVTDRRTDKWTRDDSIYRVSIASRGKTQCRSFKYPNL